MEELVSYNMSNLFFQLATSLVASTTTNADTVIDIPWFTDGFQDYSVTAQWSLFAVAYILGTSLEAMINIKSLWPCLSELAILT